MKKPLHVLMVEDSEDDALLTIHALKKGGYDPVYERVETAEAMRNALRNKPWDVILCDYQMPQFNGLAAISLLKETGIDIPLIIVSGAIGEEVATECMRLGARDFFIKGKLPRLASAVERELEEAESRDQHKRVEKALRESEGRFRSLFEQAAVGVAEIEITTGRFFTVNRRLCQILGRNEEEMLAATFHMFTHPEDLHLHKENTALLLAGKIGHYSMEKRYLRKDGETIWVNLAVSPLWKLGETAGRNMIVIEDITERKHADKQLQNTLESLRKAVGTTIQVLAYTVETRDPYTAGHQTRSADLARSIATEMELPQEKIDAIRIVASIHDIGKLSIPAEILSKPTRLSEIEFALIKEHSRKGYEMLKDVESPWPLAEIVYQHHERIDGSGYPRNLKGEDICIEARILAVADVVEAMASHRPYRPGLGIDAALNEIEKNSGIFYDDAVVDVCLRLFREKGFKLQEA